LIKLLKDSNKNSLRQAELVLRLLTNAYHPSLQGGARGRLIDL